MYSLAKLQIHMLIHFGVTALEVPATEKIYLYARYWENKLKALTKTFVTYQQKDVQTSNLHHCVRHE